MTRLKAILWVVAVSQLVLGALTLLVPGPFFDWMGLSVPPIDNNYMLGMLSSRFIAYGIGMAALARQATPDLFWIRNMVLIQALDFGVGAYYVATGTIGIAVAAFPMVNAAIFATLLSVWSPRGEPAGSAAA
ncbi:hypothetical protein [Oricola cellulosilytica]|uniref:DUF4345 domain-containing protein n=1 Tax=Oricola cellulosilytica TaxID=1429082 RepID=A0A4R0P532_9HYPH|nr:hypothetical protein [Oricola cellulosilytica]TCD10953.1 hypothetical protein E0D97_17530 [Oricola cellulosilytica]